MSDYVCKHGIRAADCHICLDAKIMDQAWERGTASAAKRALHACIATFTGQVAGEGGEDVRKIMRMVEKYVDARTAALTAQLARAEAEKAEQIQYDDVFRAAEAYMRECENPMPDYMHRRHLREHLFATIRTAQGDRR